jgi:type IV pilus assembly protein PilM
MQKVIGLDIGSYSIKAVEFINTFKSYEISNFYENVIPNVEELDPDVVIPACMEQLFKENNLKADRIVTAMPGQYISSRVMTFNFSDARKIETAVLAEVEDAVPFPNLDDMIVDHQILGTMDGRSVALVVMTKKIFLKSFLDHLQKIDIDPKLVDVDSLAFYNLSSYLPMDSEKCYGMVDVGHEKTSVCIVQNGVLRMFRSINMGGRFISEFLARDLETHFAEAQRVKHRVSTIITATSDNTDLQGDDKLIADRITLAANAIVKELGRTFYAFKTYEKAPISELFVSGGSTRIKGFDEYLREQLEIPVGRLELDKTDIAFNKDLTKHLHVMPQSVAIGLRAVTTTKRHSQINLRQGEFAYIQNYESVLRGAGIAFKVVAIALFLLSVSYGFMHWFYDAQIDSLQEQYLKEYAGEFRDARNTYRKGKFTFVKLSSDARGRLKAEIEKRSMAIEQFISENTASPALIIMKEISTQIPKETKVDVTLFQYTEKKRELIIKGETDSHATASSVLEAIKKVNVLKNVEEKNSGAKPGSDNIIEFTVQAQYEEVQNQDSSASG